MHYLVGLAPRVERNAKVFYFKKRVHIYVKLGHYDPARKSELYYAEGGPIRSEALRECFVALIDLCADLSETVSVYGEGILADYESILDSESSMTSKNTCATTPYNCPKLKAIFEQGCAALAARMAEPSYKGNPITHELSNPISSKSIIQAFNIMKTPITLLTTLFALGSLLSAAPDKQAANGKLKVFVLAGQSNMVGFGQVKGDKPGTMETCVEENPEDYGHLVNDQGEPVTRNDVWLVNLSYANNAKQGWLTTGFGNSDGHIGPEYAFGFQLGDYYEDPVLLIKCAWGGRSLYHNFLPPSAGDYPEPEEDGDKGFQYAETVRITKEVTQNLKSYFPDYQGKGYEIVGFGWHQGWNDRINQDAVDAYEANLMHLIQDLRKDLGQKDLPFVIANSGFDGWDINKRYRASVIKHLNAQLAVADANKYPKFKGNVAAVETRDFYRPSAESPSKQGYHWSRNWETFYLIGLHMGQAMIELVD